MKKLLDMSHVEARNFFMKSKSYCSIDLPSYFDFAPILKETEKMLDSSNVSKIELNRPGKSENLNHRFLMNKNGEYSWRPLEIINPVLYTELVWKITTDDNWQQILERFKKLQQNDKIRCLSLPFERPEASEKSPKESIILKWWEGFEQQSIALSLKYSSMAVTDIADCYGSIYTHTISWALHGREDAKQKRKRNQLLGNEIDGYLQDMHNGQTNGIPQGSVLSDFLAEMVLGYADLQLSQVLEKNEIKDYQILRYRDDYRIFTNTKEESQRILLLLTQVLGDLNFKLNNAKTFTSDDIITSSIKKDKIAWICSVRNATSLQKSLLIIREFAKLYPNSGSLTAALSDFRKEIETSKEPHVRNDILLAILTDIMLKNPRIYATSASIISKLLSYEDDRDACTYFDQVKEKFNQVPNTGMLELWMQRVSWKYNLEIQYDEPLCALLDGSKKNTDIWSFPGISNSIKNKFDSIPVINKTKLSSMNKVMELDETELFLDNY